VAHNGPVDVDFLVIVAHRTRQFEAWLADRLENFMIHQEGQVSRIPKQVRNMSMREFGQKYGGSIQNALRGFQKERLVAAGGDAALGEIDKSMRKRKWMASQDADSEPSSSQLRDDERQPKSGRSSHLVWGLYLIHCSADNTITAVSSKTDSVQ